MIKKTIIDNKNILIALIVYTFLLLFFNSMMSPLYPINDWSDINLYFNMGKAMMNGRTLYTEIFDHKGPFIFVIYGIGYLISNTSFLGLFFIQILGWSVMLFSAFLTARLYLDKIYAYIIALIFPLLLLPHTFQGGSAEEFVSIVAVISLYLFVKYFKDESSVHKPAYMLLHGIMVAIALLTKINLVVFWFFPLAAIFISLIVHKEYRNLWLNIAAFIGGFLIIALPICIYLLVNNALGEAWDIYITLNRSYAKIGTLAEVLEMLAVRFYLHLRFKTIEFVIVLLGAIYFPMIYLKNKLGRIAIPLSFFSIFAAILIATNYIGYYSIPYYIYSLLGCVVICKHIRLDSSRKVYIVATIIILAWSINNASFFGMNPSDLISKKEIDNMPNQICKVIKQEDHPTLLNFGLDANNTIFTKLNIVPSVKYFVTPNLPFQMYPQMRNEQTKYIENKAVQFIILPEGALNFDHFFNLPALKDNYTLIQTYKGERDKAFYLYKRKD